MEARLLLFLDYSTNSTVAHNDTFPPVTTGNVFLAVFAFFVHLFAEMYFTFALLAFGLSSMVIWLAATNFLETLKEQQTCVTEYSGSYGYLPILKDIKDKYRCLVDLADEVNMMWSGFGLFVLLILWTYMSTDLHVIWRSKNYVWSIHKGFVFIFLMATMVVSAESCRRVSVRILEMTS